MKKIAVIGGGVSGLYAAYHLSKNHDVTLFERSSRIGGHAQTLPVKDGRKLHKLDIAFLVFNSHAYPMFLEWMEELGVTKDFENVNMSFGIETKGFNYSINNGLSGLNIQGNALNWRFWDLLSEIKRYRKEIQNEVQLGIVTLSKHFLNEGYDQFFIDNFIYPLAISIWSLPGEEIDKMLAQTFCQFMGHHRFLKENYSSQWLTFANSSKTYKDKVLKKKKFSVVTNAVISKIDEDPTSIILCINGQEERFDGCIVATPADSAAQLVEGYSSEYFKILSQFTYQPVKAYLHNDPNFMPVNKNTWSSWNVLQRGHDRFITYYLNKVRTINSQKDYFVTIGNDVRIAKPLFETTFRHLILNANAFKAQSKTFRLNEGRIAFAGSYFGKGFHEDAIVSSRAAIDHIESFLSTMDAIHSNHKAPELRV